MSPKGSAQECNIKTIFTMAKIGIYEQQTTNDGNCQARIYQVKVHKHPCHPVRIVEEQMIISRNVFSSPWKWMGRWSKGCTFGTTRTSVNYQCWVGAALIWSSQSLSSQNSEGFEFCRKKLTDVRDTVCVCVANLVQGGDRFLPSLQGCLLMRHQVETDLQQS